MRKRRNTKGSRKKNWRNLLIFGSAGLLVGYLLWIWAENSVQIKNIEFQPGDSVPHNRVCMVKNQILDRIADSIFLGGETYFGCCEKCLFKLENNLENVRMAVDPTTMRYVDKSQAFITPISDYNRRVKYFQSFNNFLQGSSTSD